MITSQRARIIVRMADTNPGPPALQPGALTKSHQVSSGKDLWVYCRTRYPILATNVGKKKSPPVPDGSGSTALQNKLELAAYCINKQNNKLFKPLKKHSHNFKEFIKYSSFRIARIKELLEFWRTGV